MRTLLVSAAILVSLASDAVAATPQKANASDTADKLICRRYVETGSLVKGIRVCKSRREWDKERAAVRESVTGNGPCASAESGTCQ